MYQGIIQDRLRPFVNKYSGTPQAKEVEEETVALLQEEKLVMAGQMKREGNWISASEVARTPNTNAYKFRRNMNEKAAKGDYVGALREFDLLRYSGPGLLGLVALRTGDSRGDWHWTDDKKLARMMIEQPTFQKLRENGLKGGKFRRN